MHFLGSLAPRRSCSCCLVPEHLRGESDLKLLAPLSGGEKASPDCLRCGTWNSISEKRETFTCRRIASTVFWSRVNPRNSQMHSLLGLIMRLHFAFPVNYESHKYLCVGWKELGNRHRRRDPLSEKRVRATSEVKIPVLHLITHQQPLFIWCRFKFQHTHGTFYRNDSRSHSELRLWRSCCVILLFPVSRLDSYRLSREKFVSSFVMFASDRWLLPDRIDLTSQLTPIADHPSPEWDSHDFSPLPKAMKSEVLGIFTCFVDSNWADSLQTETSARKKYSISAEVWCQPW